MHVLWHPATLAHPAPPGYPETPTRIERLVEGLRGLGHHTEVPELDLDRARALAVLVHGEEYVARFERSCRRGDSLLDSADNPIAPASFEAALAAVAVAVAAWDRAVDARQPVFAAIRPPGHHCERDHAMGFCFLANVAIVAAAARAVGTPRVAIVDFDVHHGNGTQHIFEADPAVWFGSLHQFPLYPGTGAASECGVGAGVGTTLNVPLPAGTGPEAFLAALDQLRDAIVAFGPDLLLVSAGFDAWREDPLGGLQLEVATFAAIGERLGRLAKQLDTPLVACLEGGYDTDQLAALVAAFLQGTALGLGNVGFGNVVR